MWESVPFAQMVVDCSHLTQDILTRRPVPRRLGPGMAARFSVLPWVSLYISAAVVPRIEADFSYF